MTVIYHRADFDGLFSAAVCKKFLPDANLIGWNFGDPLVPFPAEGQVYVVDLPPDCIEGVSPETTGFVNERLTWIDHHKSSIDRYGDVFQGYRIDGVAACRLCWQWFKRKEDRKPLPGLDDYRLRRVDEPLALRLAGEYDVWDKRDERADPFQFGLRARHDDFLKEADYYLDERYSGLHASLGTTETLSAVNIGRWIMRWQHDFAKGAASRMGFIRKWEGRTFFVLVSAHAYNSTWFPNDTIPPECDALMCWRYNGEKVTFSLYHAPGHEEHDLSPIAVKYGGGGHRGACGFSMSLEDALEVIR